MENLEKIRELAQNEAAKLSLEIESVEWVIENNTQILRIIADKDGGLDINDATDLNTNIGEALDKEDFIESEYMLEVSSPGAERELKTDKDIEKSINEYIHIDLNKEISITKYSYIKELDGYLESIHKNVDIIDLLTVSINIKGRIKKIEITKENIKFIRKAIKF